MKISSPETVVQPAPRYAQGMVRLGIRPEDLVLAQQGDDSRSLVSSLVEHPGADTLVHGHSGENWTDMTIRLPGIQNFPDGEALPLRIEPEKIHLFDPQIERRID